MSGTTQKGALLTSDEVMAEVYEVASAVIGPVMRDAYEGRGRHIEDKGKVPDVALRDLGLERITMYRRKVDRGDAPIYARKKNN